MSPAGSSASPSPVTVLWPSNFAGGAMFCDRRPLRSKKSWARMSSIFATLACALAGVPPAAMPSDRRTEASRPQYDRCALRRGIAVMMRPSRWFPGDSLYGPGTGAPWWRSPGVSTRLTVPPPTVALEPGLDPGSLFLVGARVPAPAVAGGQVECTRAQRKELCSAQCQCAEPQLRRAEDLAAERDARG